MFRKLYLVFLLCVAAIVSGRAQAPGVTIIPSSNPAVGCPPYVIGFTANVTSGTGPFLYSWNFGGVPPDVSIATSNKQNDVVIYNTSGSYTVTLTVKSAGGSTTVTFPVTINPVPVADFNPDKFSGCFPAIIKFTNTSPNPGTITSFVWDFRDGSQDSTNFNTSHTYTKAGNYQPVLYVKNSFGCKGSTETKVSPPIVVTSGVVPNFTSNLTGSCALPVTANFTSSSIGPGTLSYVWDYGDGSPGSSAPPPGNTSHPYGAAGNYPVKLTVTSNQGCSDTRIDTVAISASGTVSAFTVPDTVCINTIVNFKNNSAPQPQSSMWDYDDGRGPVPGADGQAIYSTPGIKHVTLTNTFSSGPGSSCTGFAQKDIVVVGPPVINFTASNITSCKPPLVSSFNDITPGTKSWIWDFGDGTPISTLKNPAPHTYSNYGSYIVKLTASTAAGCASSKSDTVLVQAPTLQLIGLPAYGCAPLTFTTSANASTVDGVAFYSWNFFGNGNSSTLQAPPPQTYGPGSSIVVCKIVTNGGCTVSDTGVVKVGTIKPSPAFTINPSPGCVKAQIQFTDGTPGANQWFWSFGDGQIDSTQKNPSHQFLNPGTFNVKLIAYIDGCLDSVTHPLTINPPKADFIVGNVCGGNHTSFNFIDKSTGVGINSWKWDFGDGSPIVSAPAPGNISYTYASGLAKTYTVKLIVSIPAGCTDTISYPVSVNQGSTIGFSSPSSSVCANSLVYLTANTLYPMKTYTFDMGNGDVFTGGSASFGYTFKASGSYTIKLITTDSLGCKDSATTTYIVNGPSINYNATSYLSCSPMTVNFNNLTTANGSAIKTTFFEYGDGSTYTGNGNSPIPPHQYSFQGVFQPRISVVDANGCVSRLDTAPVIKISTIAPSFTTPGYRFCPSSIIQFTNTSTGGFNPKYYWNFGDGPQIDSVNVSPIHNYTTIDSFAVTLTVKDTLGCSKTFVSNPKIVVDTPSATFIMSDSFSSCPPLNVKFTFTGHYADTTNWFFDKAGPIITNPNPSNPNFLYTQPGDYYTHIVVKSPGGCIATSPEQHIHIDGPIAVLDYNPISGCESLNVNFMLTTSNVVSYIYVFGDGTPPDSVTTQIPSHLYSKPGVYRPFVIVEDAAKCRVTEIGTNLINVDHINSTKFTANKTIVCDTGTIRFKDISILADSAMQVANYVWKFNDGSPDTSGLLPSIDHLFTTIGPHTVEMDITTLGGCTGTYSSQIVVGDTPKISISGLANTCEPAMIPFTGNDLKPGPYSPVSWNWDFGNGQKATVQNPAPVSYPKAGEYVIQLKATNAQGCSTSIDTTKPNHLLIYPVPLVNAGPDATVCDTSIISLNATGSPSTSFTWLPPNYGIIYCMACANTTASSPQSTYFVVEGTSLNNCKARDTVNITVNTQITVTASGTDSVCLGQSAQLNATGGAIYTWSPAEGLNDPTIANPQATPDASQIGNQPSSVITYTVTGYDNKKCYSDTKSIDITAFNYPVIDMPNNATINVGSSYQIISTVSTNVVSLQWTPSGSLSCGTCLTTTATPSKTTRYDLKAVNDGGCTTIDSILIQVVCNGSNFFVPNSFSPNGDGVNDHFIVNGVGLNVIPSITIYNRWGQIVFQKSNFAANSPADAWDGTFNGQPAPPDVYIYTIQILCNNATLIPYHGNVTLIR